MLRFALYANCIGSKNGDTMLLNCLSTKRSHDFMTTDVNATGRRSFAQVFTDFLGTGMMQDAFHNFGMHPSLNDKLKM